MSNFTMKCCNQNICWPHNAKIELESQPDEGTTIRVIFPI